MRVFKSRAEAEATGAVALVASMPHKGIAYCNGIAVGVIRTDLEAKQNEALEHLEWDEEDICCCCGSRKGKRPHAADCKLSLALAAFRGEP